MVIFHSYVSLPEGTINEIAHYSSTQPLKIAGVGASQGRALADGGEMTGIHLRDPLGVSINGGTPIAGWFIIHTIPYHTITFIHPSIHPSIHTYVRNYITT